MIGLACTEQHENGMAKKIPAAILVAAMAVALTLIGVLGLGSLAMRVATIANPALRATATIAEIAAGILWLLGTIFLATRLAVLIFAPTQSTPD
jgi:hypothetical protein